MDFAGVFCFQPDIAENAAVRQRTEWGLDVTLFKSILR
jgi:hypothetical protein